MPLLKRSDILGGLFLVAVGGWALWLARALPFGTLARMGSGFAPRVLAITVIGFGMVVILRGLASSDLIALTRGMARPALCVGAAIFAFAMLVERAGLVTACLVTVVLAALAEPAMRARDIAILAVVAATCAALLFVGLLGLNFPLWPT